MADLPHPWGAYLRLQDELRSSTQLNNRNRGLEAGLNSILETKTPVSAPKDADIDRAVASEARRDRHQAMLRRKYLPVGEPQSDPWPLIESRAQLRLIRAAVSASDWSLLLAVGLGYEYKEIAGRDAAALRVQVLRLRRHVAKAA
jgi:hypothetical protein